VEQEHIEWMWLYARKSLCSDHLQATVSFEVIVHQKGGEKCITQNTKETSD
jgi:hypothetical protein